VPWELFEGEASRYEGWYATPGGQRADQAGRALLEWLLARLPGVRSVLEVGCGTGHFAAWFADKGLRVVGLERQSKGPCMCLDHTAQRPPLWLGAVG
jgi:SAM-dependent methyltransferase